MEALEFNGARFWVESLGSEHDPTLVLIHSGVATARMWDPIVAALSVDHHVIRYDSREFGLTTTENVEFSDVDDLLAVMGQRSRACNSRRSLPWRRHRHRCGP